MANVIVNLRPTTELEAINIMLGAINEAPLATGTDLTTLSADDVDVEQAVGILKETCREMLAAGWRFNTLTGYELAETATVDWVDSGGTHTTLNVFKVPADVLAWKQTPSSAMVGLDLIERQSLQYKETGVAVNVLFDRVKNRDGADAASYPFLYLDSIFSVDFVNMPETARKYATIVAARRLAQRVATSEVEAKFSEQDEFAALRALKRDQGLTKPLNLFDTQDAFDIGGRRWQNSGGGFFQRTFPGG